MLSQLPNLVTFYVAKQVITLPDVTTGTPKPLTLLDHNGKLPQYTFTVGQGSYNNGALNTIGENKLAGYTTHNQMESLTELSCKTSFKILPNT